jgi:hypothetical protein
MELLVAGRDKKLWQLWLGEICFIKEQLRYKERKSNS